MIKLVKRTFGILIAVSLFITSIPIVEARADMEYSDTVITIIPEDTGGGSTSGGSGGNPCETKGTGGDRYCHISIREKNNRKYKCTLNRRLASTEKTQITVYDMQDQDIINPDATIDDVNLPLAGTSVGLNIHEYKTVYAIMNKVTLERYYKKEVIVKETKRYQCQYRTKVATRPGYELFQEPVNSTPSLKERERCRRGTIIQESDKCPALDPLKNPNDRFCMPAVVTQLTPIITETEVENNETEKIIELDITKVENGKYVPARTSINKQALKLDDMDFEALAECIDHHSDTFFTNTAFYIGAYQHASFQASYDISLSNSDNINSPDGVVLTQDMANSTAIYHDYNNNLMECTTWGNSGGKQGCAWNYTYTPGHYNSDNTTYYFGKIADTSGLFGIRYVDMEYKMGKTCINALTGKISYKTNSNASCGVNEYEIKNTTINGEEHWHYFIPLNIKSDTGILVQMHPAISNSGLNQNTCINAMKNTNYLVADETKHTPAALPYTNVIKPKNDEMFFVGDYKCLEKCGTEDAVFNDMSSKDYQSVKDNDGCYKRSTININAKQLFYNEYTNKKTNETTLKGFNFYYKPINPDQENEIDQIFPDGVLRDEAPKYEVIKPQNTIWDTWLENYNNDLVTKEEYESIKLDKKTAFDTDAITYLAQNISAKKTREYTANHPYTSWSNMTVDGTSNFISNEGIVTIKDPGKIYKLGCGPINNSPYLLDAQGNEVKDSNGNWIINPLYISECQNSWQDRKMKP